MPYHSTPSTYQFLFNSPKNTLIFIQYSITKLVQIFFKTSTYRWHFSPKLFFFSVNWHLSQHIHARKPVKYLWNDIIPTLYNAKDITRNIALNLYYLSNKTIHYRSINTYIQIQIYVHCTMNSVNSIFGAISRCTNLWNWFQLPLSFDTDVYASHVDITLNIFTKFYDDYYVDT